MADPEGVSPPVPQDPAEQRPQAPPESVQQAARLLYAGGALTIASTVIGILTLRSLHDQLAAWAEADLLVIQTIDEFGRASYSWMLAGGIVQVLFWVWLALVVPHGANWARVLGTVLLGVGMVRLMLLVPAAGFNPLGFAADVLAVGAGLLAVILLWKAESGPYFRPGPPPIS